MTKQSNTRINIKLWRDGVIGVLLSSAGMFLGRHLGSVTAGLLGGEPSIWAQAGKGLVWGVVIAGMQWFIVRALGVAWLSFGVNSGVESIAYGIVTGPGLVWLAHSP